MPLQDYHWSTVPFGDPMPDEAGVYAVWSAETLLYVGKAKNLAKRWHNGHHKMMEMLKHPDLSVRWTSCSEYEIQSIEAHLIHSLRPLLNSRIPSLTAKPRIKKQRKGGQILYTVTETTEVYADSPQEAAEKVHNQPFIFMNDPPEEEVLKTKCIVTWQN